MRKAAKVLVLLLCVLIALSAVGCKHKKTKKVGSAAANTSVSGSITIYTSMSQDMADKYLEVFKKDYPNVQPTIVTGTDTEIADKLIKEKKAPVADVVWHTPLSAVYAADPQSSDTTPAVPVLAAYTYHPGQFDAVDGTFSDPDVADTPYVLGTDARLVCWAVNTGKTGGNSPATFDNLTDSSYKGQIVAPSINTEAGYVMVSSLLSADDQAGWDTLDAIDKNVTYYTDDQAAPAKAVADGSAGVGIGFDTDVVPAAAGGTAQAVFPGIPEMSPYELDVDALVNKPAPSEAAKAFLEWAISDNAEQAYAADTPVTSIDEGNGYPAGYPAAVVPDQFMQNADWQYMTQNRASIVKEWMKRYGKKIKAQ